MSSEPLLSFQNLTITFPGQGAHSRRGTEVVHGIDFDVQRGEVVALVGESGSGKTVTALAAVRLLPRGSTIGGRILLGGVDLLALDEAAMRAVRGDRIALIFQDPVGALDPVFSVGYQLVEAIRRHRPGIKRAAARERAEEILGLVGIPDPRQRLRWYPHQFSGGQCQRVMIAMALSCDPDVLIADEPTTALDVTVQQEVLDVLLDLRARMGTTVLIITHDMGVVADIADRVVVMHDGIIEEQAPAGELFADPKAEYTRRLLAAVPRLEGVAPEGSALADGAAEDPALADGDADGAAAKFAAGHNAAPSFVAGQPVAAEVGVAETVLSAAEGSAVGSGPSPALQISDLHVTYAGRRAAVRAVRGVDLSIESGEILGLVGESGSGKSTIGRAVLGLAPLTGGTIRVEGVDLASRSGSALRDMRKQIGVVFQNPTGSLNPRYTVGQSIGEPSRAHLGLRGAALSARVASLLESVRLPAAWAHRYPHELSGGQRQRVSIARAVSLEPRLLIADEPTSALDVSVQAAVLRLIEDLQQQYAFACLFISHDLAVIDQLCDRVAVMEQGLVVEQGEREQILRRPVHPYTRRLLAAAPVPDPAVQQARRAERLAAS
ncbi:peptide/nickel transport system ATP-binding protein [Nakamurella panacisegetis]|uniref:Peptide/nickel transport system ATP-binding protein n=1 Tax=Nakamurella panacisegetis TaxID=1090615 RepID=A0A1H0S7N9_9ACTN|nr:ABC transporter ATP-binding protein [Nakamurella panacisegetis]SDP37246.1 peptide/nickel transport system ATP-binding protein [Nakamurella panacisegetis]